MGAWLMLGGCAAESPVPHPSVPEDPDGFLVAAVSYFADSTDVPIAVLDTSFRPEMGLDPLLNPDSTHVYAGITDSSLVSVFMNEVRSGYQLPLPDRDDVIRVPPTTPGERIDHRALPDARALGLTRPAVSGDGSTALLEYVLNCNAVMRAICGHGGFLILERRGNAWVVVSDETRWIT